MSRPAPIQLEARWAPEQVWTLSEKKINILFLSGMEPRFLGRPDRSLFTPLARVSAEPCSGATALSECKVSTSPTGPPSLSVILQALSQIGSTVP